MKRYKWTLLLNLLLLTSCASIGPSQIHIDRSRYNDVVQDTNNQQLLMNIVRLRYAEPTAFLKLSNVTSSYSLNAGTGGTSYSNTNVSGPGGSITREFNINPSVSYLDTPTISYMPVEDAAFVTEILSPTELKNSELLAAGGVNEPTLLFRLIPQSVGDLDNASAASSAKMLTLPRYQRYYEFVDLLRQSLIYENANVLPAKVNGTIGVGIKFSTRYVMSPTSIRIKRLLHVPLNAKTILFTDSVDNLKASNSVLLRTRSVYGMMTYLSYSVQVPESDRNEVYQYRNADGSPFDWDPLMRGLMTIYSSDSEPQDAFVKVYEHRHWFYIKRSDVDSKATFSLLMRLMTLTAGNQLTGAGAAPVLTIPAIAR